MPNLLFFQLFHLLDHFQLLHIELLAKGLICLVAIAVSVQSACNGSTLAYLAIHLLEIGKFILCQLRLVFAIVVFCFDLSLGLHHWLWPIRNDRLIDFEASHPLSTCKNVVFLAICGKLA